MRITKLAVSAALAVATVVAAEPAVAQTPAAGTDITGKPVYLRKLSVLRYSESFVGRIYTLTRSTLEVTGRGKCSDGWCPLTHNKVALFARRSHIDLSKPQGEPVVSERTLRPGDEGDDVRAIQEALNKKGAKIEVDGKMGRATVQAIVEFQRKNGLTPDGTIGPETRKKLVG